MNQRAFTAIYQKRGAWYVAWVEEIPGVNTQGRTKREARENLKEALTLILEANRTIAERDRSGSYDRELLRIAVPAMT